MLYHVGDSRHTQNSQSNKVIGENEKKKVSYFTEKTKWTFWPTQQINKNTRLNKVALEHLSTTLYLS